MRSGARCGSLELPRRVGPDTLAARMFKDAGDLRGKNAEHDGTQKGKVG
jgi:hypothetical protein